MKKLLSGRILGVFVACVLSGWACGEDKPEAEKDVSGGAVADVEDETSDGLQVGPPKPAPMYAEATFTGDWAPARVIRSNQSPVRRGLLDLRGLIHAHSPYSHDACDGEPFDENGHINSPCMEDFRRDFCTVGHDFVFLTDHPAHMAEHEFPQVTLHDPAWGDTLIERDGRTWANQVSCSGRKALIMAGAESSAGMPVGLAGHLGKTIKERKKNYGTRDKATFDKLREHGAIVLYAHTEDRTVSDLVDIPVDGFEMYNLHANMVAKMGDALKLAAKLVDDTKKQPAPDLVILPLIHEDPEYLSRWGSAFAAGVKRTTTMGTDCHRNTLPLKLSDGERVDSYRRMMTWFSNHLLVKPDADGGWDDRHLKEALRKGRLYGAFEFLGYPDGFDFVAMDEGGAVSEMGDEVSVAKNPTLFVRTPTIARLSADEAAKVTMKARLLRAKKGGWDVVAETTGTPLTWKVDKPGAYRSEIRMVPRHLAQHMAYMASETERELVWIYSNVIYVK